MIHPDLDISDRLVEAVLDILHCGLTWGLERQIIDLEDMIWIPVICYHTDARFRSAFISNNLQFIFNDEAQDTTLHQILMLKYLRVDKGMVVCCLDTHQVCMTFRGCALDPVALWQSVFTLEPLKLRINYRCGRKHIDLINTHFNLDIEPSPLALDGEVKFCDIDTIWSSLSSIHKSVKQPILGIGRTHNLLLFIALKALEHDTKACINDKQFLNTISSILRLTFKKRGDDFRQKLEMYYLETIHNSYQKNQHIILGDITKSLGLLYDKYQFTTLKEWQDFIRQVFEPSSDSLLHLETIHKAKGSENPVVCYFEPEYTPMKNLTLQVEDNNLAYIAVSRVKSCSKQQPGHLYFVKLNQDKKIPWIA